MVILVMKTEEEIQCFEQIFRLFIMDDFKKLHLKKN